MILPSNGTLVFYLQIYFLNSRFRQVMQIRESKKSYKTEPFMKMRILHPTCMA
jgi:deoxyadenosine/deoxycytidine kinase